MAEIYICSLCQRPALRDADGACVGIHDASGNYKHIECPIDTSRYAKNARSPTPYTSDASDASDTDRSCASSGDELDDRNYRNDKRSYASARFLESYEKRANASKFSKFAHDEIGARHRSPTPIPRISRMSLYDY